LTGGEYFGSPLNISLFVFILLFKCYDFSFSFAD
jgi:hypothetical protein